MWIDHKWWQYDELVTFRVKINKKGSLHFKLSFLILVFDKVHFPGIYSDASALLFALFVFISFYFSHLFDSFIYPHNFLSKLWEQVNIQIFKFKVGNHCFKVCKITTNSEQTCRKRLNGSRDISGPPVETEIYFLSGMGYTLIWLSAISFQWQKQRTHRLTSYIEENTAAFFNL